MGVERLSLSGMRDPSQMCPFVQIPYIGVGVWSCSGIRATFEACLLSDSFYFPGEYYVIVLPRRS